MDERDSIYDETGEKREDCLKSIESDLNDLNRIENDTVQDTMTQNVPAEQDVPAERDMTVPPFVPNHTPQQTYGYNAPSDGYVPNAPQGIAPQGIAPQGMAPQGMAPQGIAPQGMAPQPNPYAQQPQYRYNQYNQYPQQPAYAPQPQFCRQPMQQYEYNQYGQQPVNQPMQQNVYMPQNAYLQNPYAQDIRQPMPPMPPHKLSEAEKPSATIAVEKKPVSNAKFAIVLSSIIVGVIVISLAVGLVIAKMSENGDFGAIPKTEIADVNLPLAERPQLEEEYYQEDGKYTTVGVAKALYPSIFRVDVYQKDHATVSASGSAIVLTADGYLVTNAHVIEDAIKVEVVDFENNTYPVEIIGSDEKTDVAVLRVKEKGLSLTPAQFGNSDQVVLGEQVMSIGNTLDQVTTSFGWVTSIERDLRANGNGYMVSNIQTDAACNPGNSGGALVNMYGQVIGMITSGMDSSYFSMISFAMTSNEIKPVIESLIEDGYVAGRPRVGIMYTGITNELADKLGIKAGMYVQEIDESCDVANCGLEVYDVITEVNGHEILTSADTLDAIDGMKPGDECTIHVMRYTKENGVEEFDFTFMLAEAEK